MFFNQPLTQIPGLTRKKKKMFLIEMFKDFTDDGWLGWVMIVLMSALLLAIIGLIGYGVFYLFDYMGTTDLTGLGTIVEKEHHSAYTTFMYSGKVMIPQHHPERWSVMVELNGLFDEVDVDRYYWEALRPPRQVDITYSIGRYSGGLSVSEIK